MPRIARLPDYLFCLKYDDISPCRLAAVRTYIASRCDVDARRKERDIKERYANLQTGTENEFKFRRKTVRLAYAYADY